MGCVKWLVVLLLLQAVLLAYLLNFNVPAGISEPGKFRALVAGIKVLDLILIPLARLCSGIQGSVNMVNFIENAVPIPIHNNTERRESEMDGIPVSIFTRTHGVPSDAAIIYMHGGGWVYGSPNGHAEVTSWFALHTGMMVVSVHYRLAPKHVFPAAFDDCVKTVLHFLRNSEQYGVDPTKVFIVGDSAGGNLAAAVSLYLRDIKFTPTLKAQILIYPPTQALNMLTPSYMADADPILPKKMMTEFWLIYATGSLELFDVMMNNTHAPQDLRTKLVRPYLDVKSDSETQVSTPYDKEAWGKLQTIFLNPYFAPMSAESLHSLPPAFILTMETDVLRDDGLVYKNRLISEHNDVTHKHYPTACHAILSLPVQEADVIKQDISDYINNML